MPLVDSCGLEDIVVRLEDEVFLDNDIDPEDAAALDFVDQD